jgi:preprotein translocase subunit Sss1
MLNVISKETKTILINRLFKTLRRPTCLSEYQNTILVLTFGKLLACLIGFVYII